MMKKNSTQTGRTLQKHSAFKKAEPYIWMLPSIILMAVFIVIPVFTVFRVALSEVSRAGVIKDFNNFDNFIQIFKDSDFHKTLWNTLVWTVSVVGLSTLAGFVIAMVLNVKFPGRKIVRAIVVFPWATSLIIQSVIWKYIIDPNYGSLNVILRKLGIISEKVNWTGSAEAFFTWECWIGIFVTVPFVTFCVLSGLQSIDGELYEAADIDGASFWQQLIHITLPLLKPSLTVSTVLNIIYVFNSFPIVWTISQGDPGDQTHTLATFLYKLQFRYGRGGQAAAVSVVGFVILCVLAGVYMVMTLRAEKEEQ